MESIRAIQEEIVTEFEMFEDWLQKYDYLIELGKDLEIISDEHKIDDNLIKGCQSKVWVHAEMKDGKVVYTADSDAIITKGIISLLIRVFSHQTPEAILNAELDFIERVGLHEHLSITRSNGLVSMIKQMKFYAIAFQSQLS